MVLCGVCLDYFGPAWFAESALAAPPAEGPSVFRPRLGILKGLKGGDGLGWFGMVWEDGLGFQKVVVFGFSFRTFLKLKGDGEPGFA